MNSRWLLAYPRNWIEAKQTLLKIENDWREAISTSQDKQLQFIIFQIQNLLREAREKSINQVDQKWFHQRVFITFQKWLKNKGFSGVR